MRVAEAGPVVGDVMVLASDEFHLFICCIVGSMLHLSPSCRTSHKVPRNISAFFFSKLEIIRLSSRVTRCSGSKTVQKNSLSYLWKTRTSPSYLMGEETVKISCHFSFLKRRATMQKVNWQGRFADVHTCTGLAILGTRPSNVSFAGQTPPDEWMGRLIGLRRRGSRWSVRRVSILGTLQTHGII
jgi:hypothetical protein